MISQEEENRRLEEVNRKNAEELEKLKNVHVLRNLVQYGKGYWRYAVIAWVAVFVEVICEICIPYFSRFIIHYVDGLDGTTVVFDNAFDEFLSTTIGVTAGIMGGLAIISCTMGIVAGFASAKASAGFSKNLRQAMYYKIQDFSFKNIDHFSTASLITRLTTDVTNVQFSIQMILRMIVRAPMMMVIAFIMSVIINWQISMVFVFIIPFLGFFLFFIAGKVHPTFVKIFNAYDDLNASVEENLDGIRVVKSFGREDFEKEKFGKVSYFIYKNFVHAERLLAFNEPLMQFAIYTAMIVIGYFGSKLIVDPQSNFDKGDFTSMITYVSMILNSLMMVSMCFVMVTISRNSAERITEVIIEEPSIRNKEDAITEVKNGQVDFDHVSFHYNEKAEKEVLDDIDVHIPSGSVVGIIGATGSSKSSFVNLIARLYDVTGGSVKVAGVDVRDYDLASLRDAVAVVLQKNVLFSGTVRSNLLWGNPNATQEDIERVCKIACLQEFIAKHPGGYDGKIEQGGRNVSGGQRQRLCIARALLKSPKILILDDSTSAVDTQTDAAIRHSFQTEIPDVTKFIVAQRVLSIKDADIILVLDGGKIIAQGSNDELMKTSDVYRELYETQLGGGDFDAAE